jgi:hypothetical protein
MRRTEWRENFDKERERVQAKKDEVIERENAKQESIMNYRAKQASLISLRQ